MVRNKNIPNESDSRCILTVSTYVSMFLLTEPFYTKIYTQLFIHFVLMQSFIHLHSFTWKAIPFNMSHKA